MARPKGLARSGAPWAILDFLETNDGTWYTIGNVADWIGRSRSCTARAVWRLVADGRLEQREMYGEAQFRVPDRAALDALYGVEGAA